MCSFDVVVKKNGERIDEALFFLWRQYKPIFDQNSITGGRNCGTDKIFRKNTSWYTKSIKK
ncbi:hypothetical protein CRP01_29360 [Flavilitoribacter nigricans DSM 23189 = NBRC 102662]|uniref:Uncharacterized protein n=1 Tax=Flavilitoribacter nigricans (strain ATCC 23147 / DSM 23189 / NBRC 102662 / NCIMB 1420 / SS-2) TaxID=1122177 RepID=A0A2D0N397_FLAN2|nr:hypothetical protein CRP01_29360 [Flavilitoribacter nigricans DSM 23189 = NBRC 102662]